MTICVKVIGGNFRQDFHHFSSKFHDISGYFYVHLKFNKIDDTTPWQKSINNQKVRNVNKC